MAKATAKQETPMQVIEGGKGRKKKTAPAVTPKTEDSTTPVKRKPGRPKKEQTLADIPKMVLPEFLLPLMTEFKPEIPEKKRIEYLLSKYDMYKDTSFQGRQATEEDVVNQIRDNEMMWDDMLDARPVEHKPVDKAVALPNGETEASEEPEPEVEKPAPEASEEPDSGKTADYEKDAEDEQEIVEVNESEVKKALKSLLTKESDMMKLLYDKHEEYNQKFFKGELSMPLITVEKLRNTTLGNYTHGEDVLKVTNHIRFNRNFIALNTIERILETLRHEMIHQWQDEVLYAPKGEVGKPGQKERPVNWHNVDFVAMANVVGIKAEGKHCTGNPANMPKAKSYNRKYVCKCRATNGYPITIWSTREVHAYCTVCESHYVEVRKGNSSVISVVASQVEAPGEDAVFKFMAKEGFKQFKRFRTKTERDEFLMERFGELSTGTEADFDEDDAEDTRKFRTNMYQKGHNASKLGYHYWVAWRLNEGDSPDQDVVDSARLEDEPAPVVQKKDDKQKAGKILKGARNAPTASEEPKDEDDITEEVVAPGTTATVALHVEQSTCDYWRMSKDETYSVKRIYWFNGEHHASLVGVGGAKIDVRVVFLDIHEPTKEREYKIENAQDIIDKYSELGSLKAVAKFFEVKLATLKEFADFFEINFKDGTHNGKQTNK